MFYIRIGASVHLSLMYEPKRKKENDNSIALQLFLSERENSFHHFSLSLYVDSSIGPIVFLSLNVHFSRLIDRSIVCHA